jgi:signal transduction histidine kinase
MDAPEERSDRHRSEVNDLVQFVLDCMEDIRRCVHQMALPEEQSLTIDAMIEEVSEHILLYAREKGLL